MFGCNELDIKYSIYDKNFCKDFEFLLRLDIFNKYQHIHKKKIHFESKYPQIVSY